MSYLDLTASQLQTTLTSDGIDTNTATAIIDYLQNNTGVFTDSGGPGGDLAHTWMGPTPPPSSDYEVMILGGADPTINTDPGYNNNLSLIVETGGSTDLTVTGSKDVIVATTDGTNKITLQDTGNDTVYAGGGDDTITGGSGHDTIYGQGGNDTIAVSGYASVDGGDGNDTITASGAGHDTIYGGAGDDFIDATNTSGGNSIFAGAGNDTIYGGAGDDTLISGSGSATMYGGAGKDTFEVTPTSGNTISIDGGTGSDTVVIDASGAGAAITNTGHGSSTVILSDGQTIYLSNVEHIQFGP